LRIRTLLTFVLLPTLPVLIVLADINWNRQVLPEVMLLLLGLFGIGGFWLGRRYWRELARRDEALARLNQQVAQGVPVSALLEAELPEDLADSLRLMANAHAESRALAQSRAILEARVAQLNTLHSFVESFSGLQDVDLLLEGLADRCRQIFAGQSLILWLLPADGPPQLKTFRGVDGGVDKIRRNTPRYRDHELYQPLRDGEVLVLAHPQEAPELADRLPLGEGQLYAAVPLRAGTRVIGALEILTTDESLATADIKRLLGTLGREAGVVVHNIQLYFEVVDERNRSTMLVQSMGEGIYGMDADLRITSFNPAAERLSGRKAADAIGRPCWEVFEGRDKDGVRVCTPDRCHVKRAMLAGEKATGYELRLRLPDGSAMNATFQARTHRAGHVEVVSIFRDVTQARQIEEMRANLLNTVTHELKTPLTSIKGCVSTLMHPKANFNPQATREFLGIIEAEADRLNHLITDLLHAAQLTSDLLVLNLQETNLRPAVERVVSRYDGVSKRHTFQVDWKGTGDVVGDLDRLEYVLQHLVSNAVKFSPQGGEIRLCCTDDEVDGVVHVSVQDQGIGIPLQQQSSIFQVFHRLDTEDTRKTYGVGMGLYLARKIVEAHSGRIWVDSELGGGARFTFSLPGARRPGGAGALEAVSIQPATHPAVEPSQT
jgi:PAS domain S-box-containing protein